MGAQSSAPRYPGRFDRAVGGQHDPSSNAAGMVRVMACAAGSANGPGNGPRAIRRRTQGRLNHLPVSSCASLGRAAIGKQDCAALA
jgi:hypothetical protein